MIELLESARKYTGVPWQEGGRTAAGLDCVGLIWRAAKDIGVDLDPELAYSRHTHPFLLLKHLPGTRFYRVSLQYAEPGDIVVAKLGSVIFVAILATRDPISVIHVLPRGRVKEMRVKREQLELHGIFRLCHVASAA